MPLKLPGSSFPPDLCKGPSMSHFQIFGYLFVESIALKTNRKTLDKMGYDDLIVIDRVVEPSAEMGGLGFFS